MAASISAMPMTASAAAVRRRLIALAAMMACVVVGAGCGDPPSAEDPATTVVAMTVAPPAVLPTAVMSAAELTRRQASALAFVDRFNTNFADGDAAFAEFSDDMVIYDPGNGDTFEGKAAAVEAWNGFAAGFPDVEAVATDVFLSVDAAAFPTEVFNLVEMADGGPLHEIRLYRFEDDLATVFDLWYQVADLGNGCFGADECRVDPGGLAARYLAAWTGGDATLVADLYQEDGTFLDSVLGIDAQGASDIAATRSERFGTGVTPECTVLDLYAQTNGPEPPTALQPDRGQVVAVAIQYRCAVNGDPGVALNQISALWLAARQPEGEFAIDPGGLILREEVFHDSDSLIAAGFTP